MSLADTIQKAGYRISDALTLQPSDIVEGVLAMRRGRERTVLVLGRMTAKEAAFRLAEVRDEGWTPVRWLRQGPEKPASNRLRYARGIA